MKLLPDLDTFAKILSDNGYDGYFTTQAAYPGRIKESISNYLESCRQGLEPIKSEIMLMGYLKWSGEDKQRITCSMLIKHEQEKFDLLKMEVSRKDQFGQLLKHTSMTNLSLAAFPKASEAIAMVSDVMNQKVVSSSRRFKL